MSKKHLSYLEQTELIRNHTLYESPKYLKIHQHKCISKKKALKAKLGFMIDWYVVSWIPIASFPSKLGWKRTSGQRKRSVCNEMMFPSGSS